MNDSQNQTSDQNQIPVAPATASEPANNPVSTAVPSNPSPQPQPEIQSTTTQNPVISSAVEPSLDELNQQSETLSENNQTPVQSSMESGSNKKTILALLLFTVTIMAAVAYYLLYARS